MYPMLSIYPLIPNIRKLGISHDEPPTIYALLNSYVNYAADVPTKIKDLANAGRAMFFDFDYPLATGIVKSDFECMILNHFMMRRIGYETVTAFKMALNVKLNEIMPEYNRLFDSIENWNIFNDGEHITRQATDARITNNTSSNTGTSSVSNNGFTSGSNSNTSDRRYSDTPQNALSDVRNGDYVSEYNYDQDTSTATSTTTSSSTNTSSNSGTNNTTDSGNQNETIIRTPSDKIRLYSEFLKNRQNVYTMIFKDLDSLFYQII